MKHLIATTNAVCLLILLSCSGETKSNEIKSESVIENQNSQKVNYGAQLVDAGFLEFADHAKIDSLKLGLETSFDIFNPAINKTALIDEEELAEFNFDFFLPDLKRILSLRGFTLDVKTGDDYETNYTATINGVKVQFYGQEDVEHDNIWKLASGVFFKEINSQLKNKKISESLYLLYEGNDLQAILLKESEYEIIKQTYKAIPSEIPYLP
ncbi:MAG TPA: hypothetical protein VFE50_09050 [Cyclobacteriaceae bacterium]|nr:hypothetical protein [Cyclobacteriaceae bacterium]